jgi:cell division topological specificity factor
MKLFNLFRRSSSAPIARERLQILLAHERNASSQPDLLGVLREEILAVISKHVSFDPDKVQIKVDRGQMVSTLAVDIEIPNGQRSSTHAPQPRQPRSKPLPISARPQWTNGLV